MIETSPSSDPAGDSLLLQDQAFHKKARALRPFYFIVVVWGRRYTDFLCNFCIPSLLSPNNLPALLNSGNKFLIATTDEDWARIQASPILNLLRQYVEPVFIRIPPYREGVHAVFHMGVGHKIATHMAFEDRAYGTILTPDLMVSDGTVAALQRHAADGVELVWTPALRFGEEPFFEHLKQLDVASIDSRFGDEGRPLIATGRKLVWAGIHSFHSEVLCCEWEKPFFPRFQIAAWWRVPDENGIILHALSWSPLLIDYDAIEHHDTSTLDNATFDADYIHRNLGLRAKLHVVQDSDEIMLASWAPLADRAVPLEVIPEYANPLSGPWEKGLLLHETLLGPACDPLKREVFIKPVYWHTDDVDPKKWGAVEKKALNVIRKYGLRETLSGHVTAFIARLLKGWRYLREVLRYYWGVRQQISNLVIQALKGDPLARERVKHGFMLVINRLTH